MGESNVPPESHKTDRWRRNLAAGDALSSDALRLSAVEEARLARRANRAANLGYDGRPRVSIRRIEENPNLEQLTVDKAVEAQEPDVVIDLDEVESEQSETIDLWASSIDDAEPANTVTAPSAPTSSATTAPASVPGAPGPTSSPAGSSSIPKRAVPEPPMPPPLVSSRPTPEGDSTSEGPSTRPPARLGPAEIVAVPPVGSQLPAVVEREEPVRRSRAGLLLFVATALAVVCGVLGALWLRERSSTEDLQAELARAQATDVVATQGLDELNNDVRTLELENERLQQQLNEMSALVLELPEGRVTEIDVPFTPTFADEENGRLIVMSAEGQYITFAEGAEGPITDSGDVSGSPTGLFAATRKAWVATEAGQIDVLSLVAGEPGLDSVEVGATVHMAPEERGYWTYSEDAGEVVRRKKSDSTVTDSVAVPVGVVDLTIGAGSVWALGDDGRVYRINTADLTVSPVDAGVDLISVTAGPDALWTLSAADGSLRRVDPVTGEVLVTVPVGRDPIDAEYAGGSVWVALRSGSSLIEVDTRTSAVVSRTPVPGEPTALHRGDSGAFVTTSDPDVPLLRVASLTPIEPDPEVTPEDDATSDDG